MAWRGGIDFFDPVAAALEGAPDDLKLKVCTDLIRALLRAGWDTGEGVWDDHWGHDDVIVHAFRANGIYREYCHDRRPDGHEYCREEAGHVGDHRTRDGISWPQAVVEPVEFGPATEIDTLREQVRKARERAAGMAASQGSHDHRYYAGFRDAGAEIRQLLS
jgi:hypothetical protein